MNRLLTLTTVALATTLAVPAFAEPAHAGVEASTAAHGPLRRHHF